MPLIILVLLTAIAISCVAAFFSIVGLAALFAATAAGVIVMAATLEVGKIVTTKLLHTLWQSKRATWLLKGPLMVMVVCLMSVTSLGIFGYLSKGHLEQNAPMAGISIQSEGLERQVAQKNTQNQQLQTRLGQIDQNINAFLTNNQASKGLNASKQLKTERAQIQKEIDDNNQEINTLSEKLVPLKVQGSEVQAKLGPVKYVAQLFGMQDPEAAVRIVILLIMVAFDPLAICLIIAASVAYEDYKDSKKEPVEVLVEIDTEEEDRLVSLKDQVQEEVHAFKSDLSDAQEALVREKEDLDIKALTLEHELERLRAEDVRQKELGYELLVTEGSLVKEIKDLQEKKSELAKRESELSDRISLLDTIFPPGTTDDQAIIKLLEKNPKVLEEIVEAIEASKKADETAGNRMIVRAPK